MAFTFPPSQGELSSFPSLWGGRRERQENRTPEGLLHHLPLLRFVPEGPRGRCPGPPGRGAAQVRKLGVPDLTRPGKEVEKAGMGQGSGETWPRGTGKMRARPPLSCFPPQGGPAAGAPASGV